MTALPTPVTVLQFSDTHLRTVPGPVDEHRASPDVALAAAVTAVRAAGIRPDLVVLTGDLADDGSEVALRRLGTALAIFSAPILAIAGNHDRLDSVEAVFGATEPIEIGGWRVVPIETAVPGREDGVVDAAAALRWLDDLGVMPTMVVMHHPPTGPSTHPVFGLVGGAAFLAGLRARPHVRVAATGHLHQPFEVADGHLTIVGAPSTWFAMAHSGSEYRFDPDGIVGARVWTLGAGGTVSHRLL